MGTRRCWSQAQETWVRGRLGAALAGAAAPAVAVAAGHGGCTPRGCARGYKTLTVGLRYPLCLR